MSKTEPMTDAELAEIEERHRRTTQGCWFVEEDERVWELYAETRITGPDGQVLGCGHPLKLIKAPKKSREYAEYWPGAADSAFLGHAHEDVARLLAEVRRLQGLLEGSGDTD